MGGGAIEMCGTCAYAYRGGSCIKQTIAEAIWFRWRQDTSVVDLTLAHADR